MSLKILNVAEFKAGIKKQFLEKLQESKFEIENEANQDVGDAIDELGVYDTGATKRATSTKLTTFSDTAFLTFRTVKSDEMKDFYPENVYFGRGSNRGYGPRRWLELGIKKFAKRNNINIS